VPRDHLRRDEVRLDDVRGFVFDVDGSLVHRDETFRARPLPGAVEVLEAIRASGRPLVLFTNGSHMGPEAFAEGLRRDGLPVADDELLTPVCSALTYLARRHPGAPALVFGSKAVRERMAGAGVPLVDTDEAKVVFVAHVDAVDLDLMEVAARAVTTGAKLLTANYQRGFWGANGIVFSRGAMVTAGIARVTGARPIVVGKPSRPAVEEIGNRLGVPTDQVAVVGDDVGMDIALGHLGGSRTILVRSGMSGAVDLDAIPERRRPDAVVGGVEQMLDWL
jgi:5'-nucleotidase